MLANRPVKTIPIHFTKDNKVLEIAISAVFTIVNIVLSAANAAVKNLEKPSFIFLMTSFIFPKIDDSGESSAETFSKSDLLSSNTFSNFFSNVSSFFLKRPPKIFFPIPATKTVVAKPIAPSSCSAPATINALNPVLIFGISMMVIFSLQPPSLFRDDQAIT